VAFLIALLVLSFASAAGQTCTGAYLPANVQFLPAFVALESGYNLVKEALNPVPTEKDVEFMVHWQSVALNVHPKPPCARIYGPALRQ
jgi:hypothetical protein